MLTQVCLVRHSLDQVDSSFVSFVHEVFSLHDMLFKLLDPKELCSNAYSQDYKVDLIFGFRSLISKYDESLNLQVNQIMLQLDRVKINLDEFNTRQQLCSDNQLVQPIRLVDEILLKNFRRVTSQPEKELIMGIFEGLTYAQIADRSHFSVSYLSRDVATELFELLTEALGYRVSKKSFRHLLEFYVREM